MSTVLGLLSACLLLPASPVAAATCPTVNQSTGAVSPAPGAGTQWPGCDLAGADLHGAELYGTNLAGADLESANISGANLTQSDLMNADLTGANLTGADLMEAMLDSTVLTGATLTGVTSDGITGTPASLPKDWLLANAYLVGPGAALANANLSDTDLTDADLTGANLTDAMLPGATLTGADLTGALLSDVSSGTIVGPAAALPTGWSLVNGYLVGPTANLSAADLIGQNLSGLTLTDADLNTADLAGASLRGADLTGANLNDANLADTDLTGATLALVQSGLVRGTPSALPADWALLGGFLLGPKADLAGATLNSFDLAGSDLAGADLAGTYLVSAKLDGTDLTGANLTDAWVDKASLTNADLTDARLNEIILSSSNLTGANLAGANMTLAGLADANLTGADLSAANLTNADADSAILAKANLDRATVSGATFDGALWSDTTCPNGTNSDWHVGGCPGALVTTPPVVTVTGVSNGHSYLFGNVPAPGCRTTDEVTVAHSAALRVTGGSQGAGQFTATCSGAVDMAGNQQKAPVHASYLVRYGMTAFLAPLPGSTVKRSSRVITVRLRLTNAGGAAISGSRAAALAAAKHVQATLRGPGISPVTDTCAWNAAHGYFTCTIRIPARVKTGARWQYTITAAENVGTGFLPVPGVRGAADPEVVHFG